MAIGLGFGAFAAGMVLLLAVLGAALVAGRLGARRLASGATAVEAILAWGLCASAVLIAAHAIPLALGVLSRWSVLVTALLLLLGARRFSRATSGPAVRGSRRVSWPVAAAAWVAGALVAGAALAYLRVQVAQPILSADALNFQVPQVVRWMQTGSLWQLDQFFPDYSNATYPHHGNVLLLSVVLPFDSAFLVRLVAVPFAGLAALAVVAGARAVGADAAWAVLAAALFGAIPVLGKVALDGAQTDVPFLAFAGAGGVFLMRHHRTGARGDLVLAALGFGLALGTKWYALTTLPLVGLVWVAARLLAGTGVARVARQAAVVVAGTLLAGGLWLARNWTQTGNPLFPQPLGPLPAPRDTIREQAGFTLAHYLGDWPVWDRYLLPTFDAFLSVPGAVVLVAPVVVLVAEVLSRRRPVRTSRRGSSGAGVTGSRRGPDDAAPAGGDDPSRLGPLVAVAAVLLVGGYLVTPYGAFGPDGAPVLAFASVRYALPAALAGAVALAWGASRLPRIAQLPLALAAVVAVAVGVREQYRPVVSWPAILATALFVGAVAALVGRRFSHGAGPACRGATPGATAPDGRDVATAAVGSSGRRPTASPVGGRARPLGGRWWAAGGGRGSSADDAPRSASVDPRGSSAGGARRSASLDPREPTADGARRTVGGGPGAAVGAAQRWAVGAAVAAVVLVVGAGFVRDRAQTGYAALDPALAWIERQAPAGRSVGITGRWSVTGPSPVLPAFGPRLRNRVRYVGPFVAGLLRRPRDEATWAARVRAARYDILVVGLEGPAPEATWARRAGYAPVASSGRLLVFARGA